MASRSFWLLSWLSLLFTSTSSAEVHYHDFVVQATQVKRLCKWHTIITVNGQLPGPTLEVRNGDSLVVNVVNRAKYNVTIHWHGVRQMRTAWADGPEYITQCPIKPGGNYTYRFTISGQEGTLWWHAHSSWLRATVYGALIVYPKNGSQYPFPMPTRDAHVLLGEWWNTDPIEVVTEASKTGGFPNISDAYTINGQPGDLCNCSSNGTTVFPVAAGETNLFRIINAAVNAKLFVSIAGHNMTVVGVDSSYTKPFTTSAMMLGPGQTTNVLVTADQPPGRYYIAAWAYASPVGFIYDNVTTTAILTYESAPAPPPPPPPPQLPILLPHNDTAAVTVFDAAIKSSSAVKLPEPVDENLFFTVGMGYFRCPPETACKGPNNTRFTASMNNFSFLLPSTCSILEAHQLGLPGVFTADFPPYPPLVFNYTEEYISLDLIQPVQATRVYPLKYGTVVQLVLQDTNIVVGENHPMHLHGYDFYVLAAGFGNFDAARDTAKFNLVDPPRRNTVGVPVKGWAVIRFVADNPGVWFMHCHLDLHTTWGLSMAFLVENGDGESQSLEPRPPDLPPCSTDEPGMTYRGDRIEQFNNNRKNFS